MKKILSLLSLLFILNSCAESIALLGPVSSGASGGKLAQSAVSSAISLGVKKQTGLSPTEHALLYVNQNNPNNQKEKCVAFLESTNSEICAAIKKDILETKKMIVEKSKTKFLNYNSFFRPIKK
tara:strand:- start:1306 stop:1677 length:372 start_codon:yes stop_codon:yes gene_type:complete